MIYWPKDLLQANNKKLSNKVVLISGDAENLDYEKESFDLVTIGFGVRNFENLEKGLKESHRVLRSKGKLIILETSVPENSIIKFFYFRTWLLVYKFRFIDN